MALFDNQAIGPIMQAVDILAGETQRKRQKREDQLWQAKLIASERKRQDEQRAIDTRLGILQSELGRTDITPEYGKELQKALIQEAQKPGSYQFTPGAFEKRYERIPTPDYMKAYFTDYPLPDELTPNQFEQLGKAIEAETGYTLDQLKLMTEQAGIERTRAQTGQAEATADWYRERSRGGTAGSETPEDIRKNEWARDEKEMERLEKIIADYGPSVDIYGDPTEGKPEIVNRAIEQLNALRKKWQYQEYPLTRDPNQRFIELQEQGMSPDEAYAKIQREFPEFIGQQPVSHHPSPLGVSRGF